MAWVTLAESDVLTVLSAAELSSKRQASIDAGQADPVAQIMSDVTALVRAYCSRVGVLGSSGTIPASMKIPALDLVALRIIQRLGMQASEVRQKAYDRALQFLMDVADSKIRLEEAASGVSRVRVLNAGKGRVEGWSAGYGETRADLSTSGTVSDASGAPATVDISVLGTVYPVATNQMQWVTDAENLGRAGAFIYDPDSTAAADGVDTIAFVSASFPGRWLRYNPA